MRPIASQHKIGRTLGAVALATGLVLALCAQSVQSQNAAQAATLARLARAQSRAHALNNPPPSGVEATTVSLYLPSGLAFDAAGDLFIADAEDNIIREVNLTGILSTVAGNGDQGFGGDGGAATSALLDSPTGVAIDAAGDIYIADTHNNRIRKVTGGVIATIAGSGAAGFSGDGAAATAATLNSPTAVAVDSSNNVYVADSNNHRIREISGGAINTVAGNGSQIFSGDGGLATAAGLDSPNGIAVDAAFNLYIGDTHNQRVRLVTHSTGIITTLAGTGVKGFNADGSTLTVELARPSGVAVDSSGTVYVADSDNQRIRTIAGGQVTTIAGNGNEGYVGDAGTATAIALDTPRSVAVQGTGIAIADTQNQDVLLLVSNAVNTVGGVAAANTESFVLNGPTSAVYGTGTLTATFANGSNTATGLVTFYDGLGASPSVVGTASLTANTATLNTSLLSAGLHSIVASYAGNASNPAIASGVYVLAISPVQLTAVASPVSLLYGQAIPTLTGTLNTVLAQDAGKVAANFTTTATATSDPGSYPIAVALTGASAINYSVALGAGSGSVTIAKAPSTIVLSTSSPTPIYGTPVTLTATVASTTSGTPAGTVNFYLNGSTLLGAPTTVSGGVATLTLSVLPVGSPSIDAVYSGNADFITSTSSSLSETVLSPEFSIVSSTAAQKVLPTESVNYSITLTPTNPTFVYPVSLSASGLPTGVTASFAPASIAVGSGASTTVLTLSASAQAQLEQRRHPWGTMATYPVLALLLVSFGLSGRARKTARNLSRTGIAWIALLALAAASALGGCGGGGFFSHSTQTYSVTVTAVSGPNTHSTNVTLTVQ